MQLRVYNAFSFSEKQTNLGVANTCVLPDEDNIISHDQGEGQH